MTTELNRERRRLGINAIRCGLSLLIAIAATYAVHHDASNGLPDGVMGVLLSALEVVFIAGIIPLVVTALYCGAVVVGIVFARHRERRTVPPARIRAR